MSALSKLPGANCEACPGRDRPMVPPLMAQPRDSRPRLAIVGEGPGKLELERGEPFVGPNGRLMMRGLKEIGVRRHEAHWTNAVPCDVKPRDLLAARKCCAPRLHAELAEAGAPVTLAVGAIGARSALVRNQATPILKWRGSVSRVIYAQAAAPGEPSPKERDTAAHGPGAAVRTTALVLPTIHPAFVLRSPQWGRIFEVDFERVGRVLRDGFTAPEDAPSRRLIIARDDASLAETLRLFSNSIELAFDVETVGLGPTHTALVCFGISDGITTAIIPWSQKRDGREPWWPREGRAVAAAISQLWRKRIVVTHNGPSFDHIVAARYGLKIAAWDDTLLCTHALHPELKKSLSHVVTATGLDVPPWKELEDRAADLDRLWTYNGRDVLYTFLAWQRLKSELRDAA